MVREFRNDLQILRGLAIAGVWIFHLRPDLLPAGFLGVDVFFVLSGFLMCDLYFDKEPGNAKAFWVRRARRILPAYTVVLIASVAVAAVVTLPHEFEEIIRSAEFSLALIPNVGFWMANTYFDKAELKPLLHFWSLGVELQFYLIFPLIVSLHRKHWFNSVVLTFVSLSTCLFVTTISPKTSFFLTPFRIWQFMFGFAAARLLRADRWTRLCRGKELIGATAAMLVLALMLFPLAEDEHPKVHALLVAASTAGVIGFGLPAVAVKSTVGRLFVILGNYSYSIYLIHFPVMVLWLYRPFHGNNFSPPTLPDIAALAVITLALSVVLFHLVEVPVRSISDTRRYLVTQGGIVACLMAALLVLPLIEHKRFSSREMAVFGAWGDRGVYRCGKLARLLDPLGKSCDLTPQLPADAPVFLLVGDSHADSIKDAMKCVAASIGVRLRLMAENAALGKAGCTVVSILREVEKQHVRTVVLHSSPRSMTAEDLIDLVTEGERRHLRVVLIDPVPVWPQNIPEALYDAMHEGASDPLPQQTVADYLRWNSDFFTRIGGISAPNFRRFSVVDMLCPTDCAFVDKETAKPFYFDSSHLTLTGSAQLLPVFRGLFHNVTSTMKH